MASDSLAPSQTRALKLLKVRDASPAAIERIRLEARAVARLSHPSLVQVHVLFEDPRTGIVAMVTDFVDGISLADALGDPRLTMRLREHVLGHVLRGLASVHEQGLAHRNLKLENVILSRDFWQAPERPTNVKIVDFGIAPGPESDTPAYLPPELVLGGSTNPKSRDVFAFGVLGSYLLSASHPTGLSPVASLKDYAEAYRHDQAFSLGGYKGAWVRVIEACTLVDPARRPDDCNRVLVVLRHGTMVERGSRPSQATSQPPKHGSPGAPIVDTVLQGPGIDPNAGASIPPSGYPPAIAPRRRIRYGYLAIGLTVLAAIVLAIALMLSFR